MTTTLTADMPVKLNMVKKPVTVRSVPADLFDELSEKYCQDNYNNHTLEEMRLKGGLNALEILCVLSGIVATNMTYDNAHKILKSMILKYSNLNSIIQHLEQQNKKLADLCQQNKIVIDAVRLDVAKHALPAIIGSFDIDVTGFQPMVKDAIDIADEMILQLNKKDGE